MSAVFDFVSLWGPWLLVAGMVASFVLLWRDGRMRQTLSGKTFGWRLVKHVWLLITCCVLLWVLEVRMAPLTSVLVTLQRERGTPVPEIAFRSVEDDSMHRLSEFKGHVVLLNLWGTYCPPCVAELPTLARLQADYRDRGLVVVTLAEEPREQLLQFFGREPIVTSTVGLMKGYIDSMEWLHLENFRPLTLIIDRDGVLRRHFFAAPDYSGFESEIKPYL